MQLIIKTQGADSRATVIRLTPLDDILIARQALPAGLHLKHEQLSVSQPIPTGHKVATPRIEQGQPVRRYGQNEFVPWQIGAVT